jgi:large subunit ribosomal protein L30
MGVILAVRIKGSVGMDPDVRKTLESLKLEKAYMAGLFPDNPSIIGMLKKVSRYLTWGRPSKQTLAAFFSKAGMPADDQHVEAILRGEKSLDRTVIIRLRPPKKGFKRSVKRAYRSGGEYGDRGEEINLLMRKML